MLSCGFGFTPASSSKRITSIAEVSDATVCGPRV
jgi:hypothetical protein